MKKILLLLAFLPFITEVPAQTKRQKREARIAQQRADEALLQNLKAHVSYLSDDRLEGRATGTAGEQLAVEYISRQFHEIGLMPKGTDGYIQPFTIEEGRRINSSTSVSIDGKNLQLHNEYFPLAFSANASVSGMPIIALREKGVPWFEDIKPWLEENKNNPHYDLYAAIQTEAERAASKGATALLIYNSGDTPDQLSFRKNDKSKPVAIPVIYLIAGYAKKIMQDKSALLDVEITTNLANVLRKGHNVIGYIDNAAPSTVVIGAHFDHLGWGEDGGTLDTGRIIRNGADDNASGTAAMLELARLLWNKKVTQNNYLFIAFSGEELGLLGSKYWLDNRTISTPVNYMINLDMVGRYDEARKLAIGGFGTSPLWGQLLPSLAASGLQIRYDSTGSGPSDHASFYRKQIPVLFFFTGTHHDYHKASDDHDKINYDGQLRIIKYIANLIEAADSKGQLAFLPTAEPNMGQVRFTVSLGVIPDYSFSDGGLRIDGVSPRKLAEKIGLKAGDVLTALGSYRIEDIHSYMKALSYFKNGDKTLLKIKRGTEEIEFAIEF